MAWRAGVVGSPIEHSLSPQLHLAGMRHLGIEGTSERFEIDETNVARLGELLGERVDSLSVTMPLKTAAVAFCDELDATAQSLGVVSSLWYHEGRTRGAATDGPGFLDSLRGLFGVDVAHMHAVVLGAGGAARAIVDALVTHQVASVVVHGRSPENVERLVRRYDVVVDEMVVHRPVDLIVNTTPVQGRRHDAAVLQGVTRDTIAVDITYDPRLSPWLQQHAEHGCRHSNGLAMLAYQAARQMNWWWGSDLDGGLLLKELS